MVVFYQKHKFEPYFLAYVFKFRWSLVSRFLCIHYYISTTSPPIKHKHEVFGFHSVAAGFVYVEHIDQLRNEQDDLNQQVRMLKETVASLEQLNQQNQLRHSLRWRIIKATAMLAMLATLAIIHEQHARTVNINDALVHSSQTAIGMKGTIQQHRYISSASSDGVTNNAPLMLCFVVGLPYLTFALVLYVLHSLDLGMDDGETQGRMSLLSWAGSK